MKTLLSILGSVAVLAAGGEAAVGILLNNNSKFDPIEKDEVFPEMFEHFNYMEQVTKNPNLITNDNELMRVLIQATLMLDEVYNSSFFYAFNTKISEVANLFKNRLEKINYNFNDTETNFYQAIMSYTQKLSVDFNIKLDNRFKPEFIKYEQLKRQESQLFFRIYDQKITQLTSKLAILQKNINDLNQENNTLQTKLEGKSKENEIINKILSMLDVSMGFINKTREIFNNAKDKVVSNYNSAAWHANNWGLGFIPFYGMAFNITFSNRMKDTVDAMQTYVATFDGKDPTAPGWMAIQDMKNNLDGLRDNILEIDPTENDLIGGLLEDAGLSSTVASSISEGISVLIDIGSSAFPGLGPVINAVLDFLGSGFNASKLAENFHDKLTPHYKEFKSAADNTEGHLNDAKESISYVQQNLINNYNANNAQMKEWRDKIASNTKKLAELGKEIEQVTTEINNIKAILSTNLASTIYGDNYYYWYTNEIADVNNNPKINFQAQTFCATPKSNLDKLKDQITLVNNQKIEIFNKLINELKQNLSQNQFEDFKNILEYKENLSNKNYDIIKNM
ncbi:hypothetical protein [Spiroplasma sp. DGKH1]|uniref:hypothetical protein n=1 Tax=Spiroplasma sp. DGKH1 TaxID=3050074 RepID=UPI0034C62AB3